MKTSAICAFVSAALLYPVLATSDQLGTVNFPTSGSPQIQPMIERAVALLHSFQYDEADHTFDEAL
jgi:hypothetical protein